METSKLKQELKSKTVVVEKFNAQLKCSKCNFIGNDLSNLVIHMANGRHTELFKSLSCNDCDFTCETESHLKMHKSFKHAVNFKFTS